MREHCEVLRPYYVYFLQTGQRSKGRTLEGSMQEIDRMVLTIGGTLRGSFHNTD